MVGGGSQLIADEPICEYTSMRHATLILLASFVAALLPSPAFAWGAPLHHFMMARATELLPPELAPFFVHFRDELIVRLEREWPAAPDAGGPRIAIY